MRRAFYTLCLSDLELRRRCVEFSQLLHRSIQSKPASSSRKAFLTCGSYRAETDLFLESLNRFFVVITVFLQGARLYGSRLQGNSLVFTVSTRYAVMRR